MARHAAPATEADLPVASAWPSPFDDDGSIRETHRPSDKSFIIRSYPGTRMTKAMDAMALAIAEPAPSERALERAAAKALRAQPVETLLSEAEAAQAVRIESSGSRPAPVRVGVIVAIAVAVAVAVGIFWVTDRQALPQFAAIGSIGALVAASIVIGTWATRMHLRNYYEHEQPLILRSEEPAFSA